MKTALLLIATGPSYWPYIEPLLDSAREHFVEHTSILWTDGNKRWADHQIFLPDKGYPEATLNRYDTFYADAGKIAEFDQVFYCDIDSLFVAPIEEREIFSRGITATLHPGFARERWDEPTQDFVSTRGTPERNPKSTAYIHPQANNRYFCGGFNGGDARAFLRMADQIRLSINADKQNGITAVWHDESHLNRYLYDSPPHRVLTPSFCYPEDYKGNYGWTAAEYSPKIVALNKRKKR